MVKLVRDKLNKLTLAIGLYSLSSSGLNIHGTCTIIDWVFESERMPLRPVHVICDSNLMLSCILQVTGQTMSVWSRWPTLESESLDRKGCRRWWPQTLPFRASCSCSASYWCMDTGVTAASPDSLLSCFTKVWYVSHFFSRYIILIKLGN